MKVIVNDEVREIAIPSVGTLKDVVDKIHIEIPQGQLITDIFLNDKALEISSWTTNADKVYLLDEDTLDIRIEESYVIGSEILTNSKPILDELISIFNDVADSFRTSNEIKANEQFAITIDSLRWFLKLLEDATVLLGRPFSSIIDKDVVFTDYVSNLVAILEKVIDAQAQKDWVLLADMIEYEMRPALEKIGYVYTILEV